MSIATTSSATTAHCGKTMPRATAATTTFQVKRTSAGRRGSPSVPGRRRFQNIARALITDQIASRHSRVIMIRLNRPSWVPMCVLTR